VARNETNGRGDSMKNYTNIEKSAFRKGEYVGYSNGKVFKIKKSNSTYGNWFAHNRDNYNEQVFAFGLDSMSEKLSKVTA
jgi:hypothetical protein